MQDCSVCVSTKESYLIPVNHTHKHLDFHKSQPKQLIARAILKPSSLLLLLSNTELLIP